MDNKSNSCFHISLKQPLCKGMLKKQGGRIKTWKQRYFELENSLLCYYKTSDKKKICGQFDVMSHDVTVEQSNDTGNNDSGDQEKFLFAIRPGAEKNRINESHEFYLFCAASKEERAEWVKQLKRVMYSHKGGAVFGYPLELTMQWAANRGYLVPKVVKDCVEFIMKHGLDTPGVFRMSGQTTVVRRLADSYDRGEDVSLKPEEHDVHTVVSLLKLFFRELPEPIVPYSLYDKLKASGYSISINQNIDRFIETLALLPPENYNLLKLLCESLKKVSENSEVNLMNVKNLACVFATNILRCQDGDVDIDISANELVTITVTAFIEKCDLLFAKDYLKITVTEEFSQMSFDNAQCSLTSSINSLDNRSSSIPASGSNDTLQTQGKKHDTLAIPNQAVTPSNGNFKGFKKRMKSFKMKNNITNKSGNNSEGTADSSCVTLISINPESPRYDQKESGEAKNCDFPEVADRSSAGWELHQAGDGATFTEIYETMLKSKEEEISRLQNELEELKQTFSRQSSSDSEVEAMKSRHRVELEKQRDIFQSEVTENQNVVRRLQNQIDCLQNENQQLKLELDQAFESRNSPPQIQNGNISSPIASRAITTVYSKEEIAEMESRIHYLECQLNSVKLRPGNPNCNCHCHSTRLEEDVSISSSSSFSNDDSHTGTSTSNSDFKGLYMEQMDAYKLLVEEGRKKREEFQRLLDQKESQIVELRQHRSSNASTPPSNSLLSLSSTSPDHPPRLSH